MAIGLDLYGARRFIPKLSYKILINKLRVIECDIVFDTESNFILAYIESHVDIPVVELFGNACDAVKCVTELNNEEYDEEEK